jgi:hypothetical protein
MGVDEVAMKQAAQFVNITSDHRLVATILKRANFFNAVYGCIHCMELLGVDIKRFTSRGHHCSRHGPRHAIRSVHGATVRLAG